MKCQCIYLHGDWCHSPDFEFQEQCPFYMFDADAINYCKSYVRCRGVSFIRR
jgi:hypothetical protein